MIYDMTGMNAYPSTGESGYAIHETVEDGLTWFEVYTDDGKGNGDYICRTPDKFWAERIAVALAYSE